MTEANDRTGLLLAFLFLTESDENAVFIEEREYFFLRLADQLFQLEFHKRLRAKGDDIVYHTALCEFAGRIGDDIACRNRFAVGFDSFTRLKTKRSDFRQERFLVSFKSRCDGDSRGSYRGAGVGSEIDVSIALLTMP